MHAWQAMILGIVEGLTEYLPVSSTGHLLLAERALGIEDNPAAKAYAIVIQFGAILAVAGLYWARVRQMAAGVLGQDRRGRQLLLNLIAAFVPAAAIGFLFKKQIDHYLLSSLWPITFAWMVGGVAILLVAFWRGRDAVRGGRPLENLDWSMALLIGWFQVLGMWPGTSRSLITIVGGLIVGLSMAATLEFSFLLGLITLTAASAYEGWKERHGLVTTIGVSNILIGLVVSALFAAISIKWMVGYLRRHGLSVFGWYRVALAIVVAALLLSGVLVNTQPAPPPSAPPAPRAAAAR